MFFTCFHMFLYSINTEFYGQEYCPGHNIFIIRYFIFAFIHYTFEKRKVSKVSNLQYFYAFSVTALQKNKRSFC